MSPAPANRGKHSLFAAILAGVLVAALAAHNANYLFHTEIYEVGDPGANSLSILRASRFQELYGAYSRWGFHHPGPAIFYFAALMEGIVYRTLHATVTPYNAQVLGSMILTLGFFAAGIGMAARWVRSRFFVPLALLLAVLHFTSVDVRLLVTSTWPACVLPLIFFCLLVAAASVAAGQGEDLPWLVTAGSVAIHSHVAQPLFVLPMFGLGYIGLTWACHRAARAARTATEPGGRFAPWRVFPRAHVFAGALAAIFLWPLLLDLLKGSQSNFALILAHRRETHDPPHAWLDAVYYFLRFGTYRAIIGDLVPRGEANPGLIGHYILRHLEMSLLWVTALLAPGLAVILHRRRSIPISPSTGIVENVPAEEDARPARWRFLGALGLVWIVSVALTLCWAHIQDGDLCNYNAWFNHAIYYVLALIGAIALSDGLESLTPRPVWRARVGALLAGACLLAAAAVCARHGDQFRCLEFSGADTVNQGRTILQAVAEDPRAPRAKLLLIPGPAWEAGTGVAVLLERRGYRPIVENGYRTMFGAGVALNHSLAEELATSLREPVEVWRMLPGVTHPQQYKERPLASGYALQIGGADIDPAKGDCVAFADRSPNAADFVLCGWSDPGGPEAPFVWSVGKLAALNFRAVPVAADASVEMDFDCFPALVPGKLAAQRLGIRWNGTDLGTRAVNDSGVVRVIIPAALWNAQSGVLLRFDLPDAVSPHELGQGADTREFAFGSRKITFHVVTPATP